MDRMTRILSVANANNGFRHVRVSLPLVPELIDNTRYFRDQDLPPRAGLDLRPLSRPRVPTLRSLVQLAVRCDSAEQFGKALRRKWELQRQQQRKQTIEPR
jgi:hypothetical protein